MWQLLPRRSRRKRGGHRLPLRVAPVPIFCRIPAGAGPSTRSGDPSEQHSPGFIMRERGGQQCRCLLVLCCCCNSLSLSLFLSLPCARMIEKSEQRGEEMRQEERGFSAGYLRAFPGTRRSELREFSTTLAADKLPSSDLAAPVSKTQQAAGERGARGGGGGGSGSPTTETFPHSVLLSRCNSTVISLCCGGVRVFLRPAIPHSHLD